MKKRFLLCFHDLSVWNYQNVLPTLRKLSELAGRPFSILVIPSTEGASEDVVLGFKHALLQLRKEGFELALHGYKHKAEFSQGRSYMGMIGMNLTGGEAEFAGLSQFESSRLLQLGIAAWKNLFTNEEGSLMVRPAAFVPPTWYSNKFLPSQVLGEKMLYEGRFVLVTKKGYKYVSPVASFAGIPKNFEKSMLSLAQMFLKAPMGVPRLALHPVDFPHLENEICDLVRLALGNGRKIAHYNEL